MCASLVDDQLDRFYSCFVLKSLSIIGQSLVNLDITVPETGHFRWVPKHEMAGSNDVDSISVAYGDHLPK
jgi:hypothetical protein